MEILFRCWSLFDLSALVSSLHPANPTNESSIFLRSLCLCWWGKKGIPSMNFYFPRETESWRVCVSMVAQRKTNIIHIMQKKGAPRGNGRDEPKNLYADAVQWQSLWSGTHLCVCIELLHREHGWADVLGWIAASTRSTRVWCATTCMGENEKRRTKTNARNAKPFCGIDHPQLFKGSSLKLKGYRGKCIAKKSPNKTMGTDTLPTMV